MRGGIVGGGEGAACYEWRPTGFRDTECSANMRLMVDRDQPIGAHPVFTAVTDDRTAGGLFRGFRRLLGRKEGSPPRALPTEPGSLTPCLPAGQRIYAIGDVHGRCDLVMTLLQMVAIDDRERGPADSKLVFLGDFIDRGPQSRLVVETMIALENAGQPASFLMGNHEELLLMAHGGDRRAANIYMSDYFGGFETLLSYGVEESEIASARGDGLVTLIERAVPAHHIDWMRKLDLFYRQGDYAFVHAGVRPGIALQDQTASDLRWIRHEFLEDDGDHGAMIVHGHSITEAVDEQPNRIGIDTGAFMSGKLTALGLQGTERWYLQTGDE